MAQDWPCRRISPKARRCSYRQQGSLVPEHPVPHQESHSGPTPAPRWRPVIA